MLNNNHGLPPHQGLYDPSFEKDACGVGFIAHMKGKKSHNIINQGIQILINLTHRGATGADADTGDGAGILIQIPHKFLVKETAKLNFTLPDEGNYGVGVVFLPQEVNARINCEGTFERIAREEGLDLIGWRDVPTDERSCGLYARGTHPNVHQVFINRGNYDLITFERKLFILRKRIENAIREINDDYTKTFYICSLSSKTMIYKGQLLAHQIPKYYPELNDETMESAIALVHQRYSTNTFPSWDRAQPFRYLAHNGEINTLRGNVNWMNAREGILESEVLGEDIKKVYPIITPNGSDSSNLDNALELLVASGKSLAHAVSMLIPEAWQEHKTMDSNKKAFYEYHATLMEPWDGPAAIAFTDGIQIGATLDRNGLRPARYLVTDDDIVVMASETGVLPFEAKTIVKKGRLQPGKMFLIDTNEGRIISDEEIKSSLSEEKPYKEWIEKNLLTLDDIEQPHKASVLSYNILLNRQLIYGYTEEELKRIIAPMAQNGKEAIGSMGNDVPLAVLSNQPQLLFNYFKQLFAQVTNPPIDPIREKLVMSLIQFIGDQDNILSKLNPSVNRNFIELKQPILDNDSFEKIRHIEHSDIRPTKIPILFPVSSGGEGLESALNELCDHVIQSIESGYNVIILSDRNVDQYNVPIPSLLALSCVHHHLIKKKLRTKVDLIVESGDARDVMHMALLIGYGATAINPYVAFDSITYLVEQKLYISNELTLEEAYQNYTKALGNGILKILSKMGIGTLQSYYGAQIFEAVGIGKNIINKYFTGTPSRLNGIDLDVIAKEVSIRHERAYDQLRNPYKSSLFEGGNLHWRKESEHHMFNPDTISKLQQSCRTKDYKTYKEYAKLINDQSQKLNTIRGLLKFKSQDSISIDEVEPVESILKRFATGAMSFGSLSKEVHETLAIAMNRIGGKSNSGEGGEDSKRFIPESNGDSKKSAIKQVASGRFGVTTEYLVNAEELQIKMAQGAKPGEGGHLPGHKVSEAIAKVRNSTPGIDLISPPPHHDIYSIEDLAQLIFDLKNVNKDARVNVKLVSEVGVGTVAAGVAKGHADVVLISGHDGGTGASPVSSIKYAGLPWELGLSETQQTLLLNDLRSRIIVQTDGQLKTGRDVAIATLLGAEEYGFATAALVVCGCIMMRKCQNNTCPVGVATQDPELRKEFKGKPEHLINYFTFIATELREIMAEIGVRTIEEMVGRVDLLEVNESLLHWKSKKIDLNSILFKPELPSRIQPRKVIEQDHGLDTILDQTLIKDALSALENKEKVSKTYTVKNINRTVGTMLSGEVAKRYGSTGLPDDTIHLKFEGSAGQSFACFGTKGITFELEGDSNDYLGKGLSGAKVIVYPSSKATFKAEENIIVGNTLLYGATSGEVYIRGVAGERFAVRNSGVTAVVEGVGDHGCEYMTGGIAVILGKTGRNFAGGMSGGVAYVLDEIGDFEENRCNYQIVITEKMDSEDEAMVLQLITNHYNYTKSEKAKAILDNFDAYKSNFVKVISPAYKEVLAKRKANKEV